VFGNDLYAAFLSSSTETPDTAVFVFTGSAWSEEHVWKAAEGIRVTSLAADDSRLFAFTRTTGTAVPTYGLDYTSDPGTGFSSATVPNVASPFRDIASDGGTYWLAGPGLFTAPDLATGFTEAAVPSGASAIRHVYYVADIGVLFAAASDGFVHAYTGSEWKKSNQALEGADPVALSDLIDVTIGQTRVLLVGTDTSLALEDGYGYLEMDLTGATAASLATGLPQLAAPTEASVVASNFSDTQFREAVILDWHIDPASLTGSAEEVRVYAGTAGAGLWRAAFDAEVGGRIWSRE
jgi:hypothetical protein